LLCEETELERTKTLFKNVGKDSWNANWT